MKKFLVFIFLLFIVAVCSFGSGYKFLSLEKSAKIELFVTNISASLNEDFIKNGEAYVVHTNNLKLEDTLKNVSGVYGVSYLFEGGVEDYEGLKNKVKVQNVQESENICTFYGFLSGFDKFTYIDGKKVNVQIAYNSENSRLIIGFPIILGSY